MKERMQRYRELIAYVICGAGTVAVDMGIYALLVDRIGIRWANGWSWCCAVLFAFLTNKYFVFRGEKGAAAFWRELLEFLAARLLSLVLQVRGVELLVELGLDQTVLGVTGGLAKGLVTAVVIVLNYLLSKFLVFHVRKKT